VSLFLGNEPFILIVDLTNLHLVTAREKIYVTMPGWEEATAVQKVSNNTYSCILHDDWSIGSGMFQG